MVVVRWVSGGQKRDEEFRFSAKRPRELFIKVG